MEKSVPTTGLYALQKMNGSHYIISNDQKIKIEQAVTEGKKFVRIGDTTIPVHQITVIEPLKQHLRKQNMVLAQKGLRMCRRCGTTIGRMDQCPCKEDRSGNYPDLLEQAKEENPKLAGMLKELAVGMDIKQIKAPTTKKKTLAESIAEAPTVEDAGKALAQLGSALREAQTPFCKVCKRNVKLTEDGEIHVDGKQRGKYLVKCDTCDFEELASVQPKEKEVECTEEKCKGYLYADHHAKHEC